MRAREMGEKDLKRNKVRLGEDSADEVGRLVLTLTLTLTLPLTLALTLPLTRYGRHELTTSDHRPIGAALTVAAA